VTTQQESGWATGWSADDPADIGFAWAPDDGGEYVESDGFSVRDLGLDEASGGALGVRRVKVDDPEAASQWRSSDADFDFLFVISGSVKVENELGETVDFGVGGAAQHPAGVSYRLSDFSADFEAVQATSPARPTVTLGAPEGSVGKSGSTPVYTHDTDDEYVAGAGPRKFFFYRDLGTREPTGERIHFHVVRATEPGEGTGWHYHTMAQWFMVLGGNAVIRVEDRERYPLGWGDAMCVGRGTGMRHNVTDFTGDYLVLEMCVPAGYDTIPTETPEGADPVGTRD